MWIPIDLFVGLIISFCAIIFFFANNHAKVCKRLDEVMYKYYKKSEENPNTPQT